MKKVTINDRDFEIFIPYEKIRSIVEEMAEKMNKDFEGKNPLFLCILNGSFMFASDLIKELMLDCEISFVKGSSYTGTSSSGNFNTQIGLAENVEGRHILIIEDIVDSGNTLARMLPGFIAGNPASLKIASLLLKPLALQHDIKIDYVGMEIPNEFIVGYGLDYNGLGRNLRDIYQQSPE